MEGEFTLDQVEVGATATVVAVVPQQADDPYPGMVGHLGIEVGTTLLARGLDEDRGVLLFEEPSSDRRFGLPIETCKRLRVEST